MFFLLWMVCFQYILSPIQVLFWQWHTLVLGLLINLNAEKDLLDVVSTSISFFRGRHVSQAFYRWNFEQVRERDGLGYQGRLYVQNVLLAAKDAKSFLSSLILPGYSTRLGNLSGTVWPHERCPLWQLCLSLTVILLPGVHRLVHWRWAASRS